MEKIAIIGAGLMGVGFAAVFAPAGHDVTLHDPYPDVLNSAKSRLAAILNDIGADAAALHRVTIAADLAEAVATADIIIEAVIEKLPLKQDLFERIEAAARSDAIFASNTSSIPITQVMAKVKNKSRALGAHWFNPPYLVPLVEVIQTADTDLKHIEDLITLLTKLGKVAVHVKRDVPGFVGNRMQHAMWREAISLVENGVCDAETIDLVVKNSFGLRLPVLGPMENADLVGTDLALDIQNVLSKELEDRHDPNPLLQKLVSEGKLGFKTNEGFKNWTEESKADLRARLLNHLKRQLTEISPPPKSA
jgi:3-hydroxybutyryl-CoA dehydrogenase